MFLVAILFALTSAPAVASEQCEQGVTDTHVRGNDYCLAYKAFGPAREAGKTLVVLLHGDLSGGGNADYMARRSEMLSRDDDSIVAVALARPGYGFGDGSRSSGSAGTRTDHYTPDNIAAVADAVSRLKAAWGPTRTVLVGHSGGAATAGVIAGRHAGTADAFVLLACPCDVLAWRSANNRSPWMASLSPSDFSDDVPASAMVLALTGTSDTNTAPALGRNYVEALRKRGIAAEYMDVPGVGHNINDDYWSGGARAAILRAVQG
ncbi:MAG: alpha/beta hydrolase family protein [Alphaproteobacteria bacterium]